MSEGTFSIGTVASSIRKSDPCDFIEFIDFSISVSGELEAVVDWTFATNNIEIALIEGRCTCRDVVSAATVDDLEQVCPTIAESVSATAKPERITSPSNQSAGNYTLVVANTGDRVDSCSYQVTLHTS